MRSWSGPSVCSRALHLRVVVTCRLPRHLAPSQYATMLASIVRSSAAKVKNSPCFMQSTVARAAACCRLADIRRSSPQLTLAASQAPLQAKDKGAPVCSLNLSKTLMPSFLLHT